MDPVPECPVPAAVTAALREASRLGFGASCSDAVGRLLSALVASTPGGVVAESGTGTGVGTAWLRAGLQPGGTLVTVERDVERANAASALFADDARVRVLTGDWRLLADHAPFHVFFCDGGGKRDDPAAVVAMLAPGGVLVLDDFEPARSWPPLFRGRPDELRMRYLTDPALDTVEVTVAPGAAVVLGVRRVSRGTSA